MNAFLFSMRNAVKQKEYIRSYSFMMIARICSLRRDYNITPDELVCSKRHTEEDAKLYHVADISTLLELINQGADLNMQHCLTKETPLHCAVIDKKSVEMVLEYLKHGANVNTPDVKGLTPLHSAVKNEDKAVIVELIHFGADINHKCYVKDHFSGDKMDTDNASGTFVRDFSRGVSPLDKAIDNLPLSKLMIMHSLLKHNNIDPKGVIDLEPYKGSPLYEELSTYLTNCHSEITRMKNVKLNDNSSLLDWVIGYLRSGVEMSKMEIDYNCLGKVLHSITQHHYHVFKDIIVNGIGRKSLVNKLYEYYHYMPLSVVDLSDEARGVSLDVYTVLSIVKYLTKKDIFDYLIAFGVFDDDVDETVHSQEKHLAGVKRPISEIKCMDDECEDHVKESTTTFKLLAASLSGECACIENSAKRPKLSDT